MPICDRAPNGRLSLKIQVERLKTQQVPYFFEEKNKCETLLHYIEMQEMRHFPCQCTCFCVIWKDTTDLVVIYIDRDKICREI